MSQSAVRAGQSVELTEVDPCPASNPDGFSQFIEATFIDALGRSSLYSVPTNDQGHWIRPIILMPPPRYINNLDPLAYSNEAALGSGVVAARCIHSSTGTVDMEYASKVLSITGSSALFSITPTKVPLGQKIHMASSDACPAGTARVKGYMDNGNTFIFNFDAVFNSGTRHWVADFTIPKIVENPVGSSRDFPQGKYRVSVGCEPPETDGRLPLQRYGETLTEVIKSPVQYVAMGDSFSSGESIEPFEAGTGSKGGCHRSNKAYPRLLEQANDFVLGDKFVACSGATTTAITLGYNGQPPQLSKVTADTDLITMTIGGNNMPFGTFARACVKPLVDSCDKQPYRDAIAGIVKNVIPRMEFMLGTLRDRLTNLRNTGATVLVIGYPQLIPPSWVADSRGCWWLQPQELSAIRSVTNTLNTAIENEVNAIGGKFHFVPATSEDSPFVGHELCRPKTDTAATYFSNVQLGAPDEYTFHPNAEGQRAYADLIKNHLAQHPLN
ncbi:SGNH/GDSL hydrolase family protein [Amycolatopsis sp. H20-H5]|uniref:SGNH/GDSL hydrolase family protein n=1 Tax=Amycolatopsis sp. H20-H5 TaxID=3046309 RepID=UPI002DB81157|nr:SGNH/GDSL hydrolase family protein [Amycolatopsis sp. H20-H5]MEC3978142.1 SGNH/GDSL hydrolase family protein [Amycolatopsis sp. H20-H5]